MPRRHTWSERSLLENLQPFLVEHADRSALVREALDRVADDPYSLALSYFGSPDFPEKIYSYSIPQTNIEIAFGIAANRDGVLVLVAVIDWDDAPWSDRR